MSLDAVIVGGGLFGSIIARKLRSQGRVVALLDNREPKRGSGPAACLIKPSWISSLGLSVVDSSLGLLADLYDLRDLRFKVGPVHTTVHWVDPAIVLAEPYSPAEVESIDRQRGVRLKREFMTAQLVVVCAGVWTNNLLPRELAVPHLSGRAGAAWTWGGNLPEPFISPWAPYRQIVAFNRSPGEIWVGDGTAIKPESWSPTKAQMSRERCSSAVGRTDPPREMLYGIRPYVSNAKPCYLEERAPGLWIATGGAKNGTLAAAWCAHEIAGRTS